VSDIISGITTASREQLSGIEQVNQAITQMTGATQQDAAVVQASAAAAGNLSEQAQALIAAVARFKLNHHNVQETVQEEAAARPAHHFRAIAEPPPTRTEHPGRKTPHSALPKGLRGNDDDWKEF
jgi:methyl-accepting chemotaxis protein